MRIHRSADELYRWISDPTRMGEWSPENRGATVAEPHPDGAYVGMDFTGTNRRGRMRWTTACTVTAAEPARRFAFRVHAIGARRPWLPTPIASWQYTFEPVDDATTEVTESWTDDRRRWPGPLVAVFDRAVTSGSTFADFQRRNIRMTLEALKIYAEAHLPETH